MQVKTVSITKSLIEGADLSPEELIVYTARVSNPSNQMNTETADKLLRYLIKHKHLSPFDMVQFCVEVKTSRAIAAQILRHWSFDFQEFSQRYAEAVDLEPVQIREAGSTTRQGSKDGDFDPLVKVPEMQPDKARTMVNHFLEISKEFYQALLKAGVAKECARMILPLTTQTTIYMNASVRNWIFYLQQRLDPHAQLEHREVAQAIYEQFKVHFPNVVKAVFEEESDAQKIARLEKEVEVLKVEAEEAWDEVAGLRIDVREARERY